MTWVLKDAEFGFIWDLFLRSHPFYLSSAPHLSIQPPFLTLPALSFTWCSAARLEPKDQPCRQAPPLGELAGLYEVGEAQGTAPPLNC